jgi:hypothetical protein
MSGIEFVDDAGEPSPDEEELVTQRDWLPWFRIAIAAVVALGLILFAWRAPSTPTVATVTATPTPPEFTPLPDMPAPVALTAEDARRCPRGVLCSVLSGLPVAAVSALQAYLPGVRVGRSRSIQYVAPDQHRVVVWFRDIRMRLGHAELEIRVEQPRTGLSDAENSYLLGATRIVRLQRVFQDRMVVLSSTTTGEDGPKLSILRALANDVRLVAA